MQDADHILQQIEPTIRGLGYELWGIERNRSAQSQLVRVFIDTPAGIVVEDCERVSAQVADLIDANELILGAYTLEVSSPGVERILFQPSQWPRFVGEVVQVRLRSPIDGKRKVVGKLLEATAETVTLQEDTAPLQLRFSAIERARLVPDWSSLAAAKKPTRRGSGRAKIDREAR
ncbi:MAG: ribosome maturation factor RimP [Gammaproteobacteria bacterium]|nr:ribosome maturation factor RimP [Gammaproteobacteria bacterium]